MNSNIKILKSLGFLGSFRFLFSLILSKICFPNARIIRYPFYIRNEGKLNIGKGFSANVGLIIDVFGKDTSFAGRETLYMFIPILFLVIGFFNDLNFKKSNFIASRDSSKD